MKKCWGSKLLIAIAIAVSLLVGNYLPVQVNAAVNYNADVAVQCARSNYTNGSYGLCAEFVARCLQAGGLGIGTERGVSGLRAAVINTGRFDEYELSRSGARVLSTGGNSGKVSVGDVIIYQEIPTGSYAHAVIVTKIENGKVFCTSRNANYVDNEWTGGYYNNNYSCSNGTVRVLSLHYKGPASQPKITSVGISEIDPYAGSYLVTVNITSDYGVKRVQFPTWTTYNGQDDLPGNWGDNPSCSGMVTHLGGDKYKATYTVSKGAHNNETGIYVTHIYVWDSNDSVGMDGAGEVDLTPHYVTPLSNGHYYRIKSACSGKYLSVPKGSETVQAQQLVQYSKADDSLQIWEAIRRGAGYSFKNAKTGMVCDIYGGETVMAKLTQYPDNGSAAQIFKISGSNGKYAIVADCSNLVWDLDGGKLTDNAGIIQYKYHGSDNQLWNFEEVAIPSISKQPLDARAAIGEKVEFAVEASNSSSFQWYVSENGKDWNAITSNEYTGFKTNKLSFSVNENNIKYQFRCKLTSNSGDTVFSNPSMIMELAKITEQPSDVFVLAGETVALRLSATGVINYQWYYSQDDGKKWNPCESESAKTDKLIISVEDSYINQKYKCIVTGKDGSTLTSNIVTIKSKLVVSEQPSNVLAVVGDNVTFSIVALGASSYQWYYSDDDVNWIPCDLEGADTSNLTFTVSSLSFYQKYKCEITGEDGSKLTSDIVAVNAKLAITKQPEDVTASVGDTVYFELTADGVKEYQWYYSQNDGRTWTVSRMEGSKTNKLTVPVTEKRMNQKYKCVVTGENGKTLASNAVSIKAKVIELVITKQPENISASVGETISFTLSADGANSYQWYYSQNDGKTWTASGMEGSKTNRLIVPVTEKRMNQKYKCVVTGLNGKMLSSNVVAIKAKKVKLVITQQPEDVTAVVGETISFTLNADGAKSYQWYYSQNDGKTWNVSGMTGAKTNKLTVPVTAARMNQQYRCKVIGEDGSTLTSNIVVIKAKFAITKQPEDAYAAVGDTIRFTVIVAGARSYQWYYSHDGGKTWKISGLEGSTTEEIIVPITEKRMSNIYRCTVIGLDGSTLTSNVVSIKAKFAITKQPEDVFATVGETIVFSLSADGVKSYQWYFSQDDGKTWKASGMTGSKTSKLTVPVTAARINQLYKCIVTGEEDSILESNVVTIKDKEVKLAITKQPVDVNASIGDTVNFTIEAEGVKSYQWYYSHDGGKTWKVSEMQGSTTDTLIVPVNSRRLNNKYRCTITGEDGSTLTSDIATLKDASVQNLLLNNLIMLNASEENLPQDMLLGEDVEMIEGAIKDTEALDNQDETTEELQQITEEDAAEEDIVSDDIAHEGDTDEEGGVVSEEADFDDVPVVIDSNVSTDVDGACVNSIIKVD